MKMHSIQIKLKAYASRLFFKQVVYVDNDDFYNVNFKTDNTDLGKTPFWQKTTSATGKIAILARNCYREQLQWYPITKRSDIAKLLQIQLVGAGCPVLYVIGAAVNGKTPVTYYYLDKLPIAFTAWLYIPETLLLAANLNYGEILSYSNLDNSRTMFVAKAIGGVVSAYKGGVIQSSLQFALSQGMNLLPQLSADDAGDDNILTGQQLGIALLTQITSFYKLPLLGLINRKAINYESTVKSFISWGIPSALVFSLYLVIVTQLASLLVESNKSELVQAKVQANSILGQRQSILEMNERLLLLNKYSPSDDRLLQLWEVLSPLYQNGVVFQKVQKTAGKIILQVEATSASKVLGLLISQPGVSNAQFDSAVRRQGNIDEATISFTLKSPEVI
jgi:hypothetical protein